MRLMHGASRPASLFKSIETQFLRWVGPTDYVYMFPELLADPQNLLESSPTTGPKLMQLAQAMSEPAGAKDLAGDSNIPAVMTYFGQFIDHDITLEVLATDAADLNPSLGPIADPLAKLSNERTCLLDLDSLYADPAPRAPGAPDQMSVGRLSAAPPRPAGRGEWNDLPRQGRNPDPLQDRAALIGDPRNDENLIVAQLHVAFLKAHNALVRAGESFDGARRALRVRYHDAVLGDFLRHLLAPDVYQDLLQNGPRFWLPTANAIAAPLEFTVAAFRTGHSMIRASYDINGAFGELGTMGKATLESMFTLSALSGNLNPAAPAGFDTLPENWVVEWSRLAQITPQSRPKRARRINTQLAFPLEALRNESGQPIAPAWLARLAARNLLRGYRLKLPTGQAIATRLGEPPLRGPDLIAALPAALGALVDSLGFADRTPLWFYILAEAGDARPGAPQGLHLGPVGSRLVGETLYNLAKFAPDSVLPPAGGGYAPQHSLADIIALAGP